MAACSSCDARILWTISPTGAKLPLDAVKVARETVLPPAVPYVLLDATPDELGRVFALRAEILVSPVYVSHFTTCPNAAKYSKRRGNRGA